MNNNNWFTDLGLTEENNVSVGLDDNTGAMVFTNNADNQQQGGESSANQQVAPVGDSVTATEKPPVDSPTPQKADEERFAKLENTLSQLTNIVNILAQGQTKQQNQDKKAE